MKSVLFFSLILFLFCNSASAQLPVKIVFGQIFKDDGTFGAFSVKKYAALTDSLDKNLTLNPKDTTSLFYRAVIHLFSNDVLAKPYQRQKGALENLVLAGNMAESAVSLNMKDFRLKVLRAQIYKNIAYRYTGDESWMFNSKQIAARSKEFNSYKEKANKYYDELAEIDADHAYDYRQLKVASEYGL